MANIYNLLITVIYDFVLRQFPTLTLSLEFFLILFALFAARKAINQQPSVLNYLDTGLFYRKFFISLVCFLLKHQCSWSTNFSTYILGSRIQNFELWIRLRTAWGLQIRKKEKLERNYKQKERKFSRYKILQDETFYILSDNSLPNNSATW
jgi:hypothetical protein